MKNHYKHLVILDMGLNTRSEHSYAIAAALLAELQARHLKIQIYGFAKADPTILAELDALPHFRSGMYSTLGNPLLSQLFKVLRALKITKRTRPPSEHRTSEKLNRHFLEDLQALASDVWSSKSIVLIPGLLQNQILGLARFIEENHATINCKIICQLMFPPEWTPWGKPAKKGTAIYQEAFSVIAPFIGSHIAFTSENIHIANRYAKDFGIKCSILPIPLGVKIGHKHPDNGKIQIGFFGNAKLEKGSHLLPDAIKICGRQRNDIRFTIQTDAKTDDIDIRSINEKLGSCPNTTLLAGPLTTQDYRTASESADIILLPYDPNKFGMRGSGVFTESVTGGRLVVASLGTSAAVSIMNNQAFGAVFNDYNSQSLAQAILKVCANIRTLRPLAIENAKHLASEHSPSAYFDNLLEIANQQPE